MRDSVAFVWLTHSPYFSHHDTSLPISLFFVFRPSASSSVALRTLLLEPPQPPELSYLVIDQKPLFFHMFGEWVCFFECVQFHVNHMMWSSISFDTLVPIVKRLHALLWLVTPCDQNFTLASHRMAFQCCYLRFWSWLCASIHYPSQLSTCPKKKIFISLLFLFIRALLVPPASWLLSITQLLSRDYAASCVMVHFVLPPHSLPFYTLPRFSSLLLSFGLRWLLTSPLSLVNSFFESGAHLWHECLISSALLIPHCAFMLLRLPLIRSSSTRRCCASFPGFTAAPTKELTIRNPPCPGLVLVFPSFFCFFSSFPYISFSYFFFVNVFFFFPCSDTSDHWDEEVD